MISVGIMSSIMISTFELELPLEEDSETHVMLSNAKVEALEVNKTILGEGPHWDVVTQKLYYVDILGKTVHSYDPVTKEEAKLKIEAKGEGQDSVSLIIPLEGHRNKYVISLGRSLRVLEWDGKSGVATEDNLKTLHVVDDGNADGRFNDGKCDSFGRLWAGTMGFYESGNIDGLAAKKGSLYRLERDGQISLQASKIDISNGLAWSSNNRILYYVDSFTYRIDAFDYDIDTGEISNRRKVIDLKENEVTGFPDGMCIDEEGNLWLAVFGAGKVLRINPNSGKIIDQLDLPTLNPTSVAFGGPKLDILFVTSAQNDLTKEQLEGQPLAGALFQVTGTGAKGMSTGVPYGGPI